MTQGKDKRSWFGTVALVGIAANFKAAMSVGLALFKLGWLLPVIGTMALSLVLYATVYGWSIAAILILILLIHELGHWIWMKAYGLDPKAPMFVPFLGAFVAMRKMPADEATHAWVALAGPLVGGVTSVLLYLVARHYNQPMLVAAGHVGILLNMFQLLPAKPFDGGFVISAISKKLLIPGMIGLFGLALYLHSVLFFFIALIGVSSYFRSGKKSKQAEMTVLELERQMVGGDGANKAAASANGGSTAADTTNFDTAKATVKQRYVIGASYLALTALLGGAMAWADIESGIANKNLNPAQVELLSRAIALKKDPQLYFLRGQIYDEMGQLDKGIVDLKEAIRLGKSDYDTEFAYARLRLRNGQTDDETIQTLLRAEEAKDVDPNGAWQPLFGLIICGDYKDAQANAASLKLPGERSDLEAEILERTGHPAEAIDGYNKAVKLEPQFYWGARLRRALFYISENKIDESRADIDKALSLGAEYSHPFLVQGWYLLKKGDLNGAWQSSQKALDKADGSGRYDERCVRMAAHHLRYEIASSQPPSGIAPGEDEEWQRVAARELDIYKKEPRMAVVLEPRNLKEVP